MSYVLVKNNDWTTVTCNNVQVSIPKVWQIAKLRDSVKSYIGGDYGDDTDGEDKSEVDVYTLHVFNTNYEKAIAKRYLRTSKLKGRALDVGDILLEKCGGSPKNPVGRMYQLTKASTRPRTAVNFITILKLVECVDAKYLYAHLRYLYKNGVTRLYEQKTTGIANLKTEDFLNHEIQKPSSLVEQTAIANILSDQEALIAQYDNLIALHEKRFAYLSDELLSGRLRLVKNLSSEIELVKNEEWQESTLNGDQCQFPVGWFIKALGNIAKTVTGHTPSTSNKTYWNENSGTPWFSTPDLRQNVKGYITNTSRYLTEQGAQVARVYPAKTLLVSCIATIGEVGLLPEDGAFNQQINGILPNAQIDTNYLRLWFIYKTSDFKRFAPTSVVSIINKSLFNTFEVIMPPLEEQTLIANVLSDQEALIAEYKKLRDAEKKRFDWLSDALLSGTYRVKVEA